MSPGDGAQQDVEDIGDDDGGVSLQRTDELISRTDGELQWQHWQLLFGDLRNWCSLEYFGTHSW